jgi:glucokinase
LTGKKVLRPDTIFESTDPAARKVYDSFILFTGLFFSNLIDTFNPEMIVVGGGVSNIPFYHDVQKVIKAYAQPTLRNACKIRQNALGDDSGALGAAYLAMTDTNF